jgi:hypothetical protein
MDPYSKDELEEDGAATLYSMRWRSLRVCWTGWCSRLDVGRLGEASGILMMCISAWSGKLELFLVTPFISLVDLAFVATMVASD